MDEPLLKCFLNVLLHGSSLRDQKWINAPLWQFGPRQQVNSAVSWLVWWKACSHRLPEYVLECPVFCWYLDGALGSRNFNGGRADNYRGVSSRRFRKIGQTSLETILTPLEYFSGENVWMVWIEPWASQDDIH